PALSGSEMRERRGNLHHPSRISLTLNPGYACGTTMRGTMRRKLLLAATAVTLLASPAAAQDQVKLRYAPIASWRRSVSSLALNVAQRKGFLARENIELEVVGLRGVQYQIEELDKGTVDVSHTATPYLIQLALKGSPSVGIVGGPANTIFSL